MKIAIVSPSAASLDRLSQSVQLGDASRVIARHEGGIGRLGALADQDHPDIVIAEGRWDDADELALVGRVTALYPELCIILLCEKQGPELLVNAMRAGVRELLPSSATAEVLSAALGRAEKRLALRDGPNAAKVIAFIASKGGSGATFLAANLGHQLASAGQRVLLIDLNLQFGEAVLTLHDGSARSDIAQLAGNLARLDASLLNASVLQITPRFAILAAPEDPAQALGVKPAHLDAILNLATRQYDVVILDVNRTLDDLTVKALDRATKVFLVVQAMMPYVRNAKRLLTVFRSLGYPQDKVELLVNRYWKKDDIGVDDLRTSLGSHTLHTIPNGYREVARAINTGVPLSEVARSSPVCRAIEGLAQTLAPRQEEPQAGLLSRLLGH
jgi:pilus assembly protein CpaE